MAATARRGRIAHAIFRTRRYTCFFFINYLNLNIYLIIST